MANEMKEYSFTTLEYHVIAPPSLLVLKFFQLPPTFISTPSFIDFEDFFSEILTLRRDYFHLLRD